MPPLETRMVGLPKKLVERLEKEATHRRMTTRDLTAEIVREWFEAEDYWPSEEEEEDQ